MVRDDRGLFQALLGDGRPLLLFAGLCLVLSGLFAWFQSLTGHFLPHDIQFLGMTADRLWEIHEGRVVYFMFHDRVSFGGALIAIGSIYMWLAEFPLRQRQAWAWWLFVVSGLLGFGSFLAYLGYGYLDSWHGLATLGLLPCYLLGLMRAFATLSRPADWRCLLRPGVRVPWRSALGMGRACLLATAGGMIAGGLTIMTIGMTSVFVPQDLTYMGLRAADLHALNPRLVPLIAHDRAGFGGGVGTAGIAIFFCAWCGEPTRSLWQVLCLSGSAGFGSAILVHPAIGYNDLMHLAPAIGGALLFGAGLMLSFKPMCRPAGPSRSIPAEEAPAHVPQS